MFVNMTMFPKQFLENQNHGGCYGGNFGFMGQLEGYDQYFSNKLESDFVGDPNMAEQEESRTESTTVNEAGSSSKDERDEAGWLQLGIGTTSSHEINKRDDQIQANTQRNELIELNLLPGGNVQDQIRPLVPHVMPEFRPPRPPVSNNTTTANYIMTATATASTSLFLQQGGGGSPFLFPQHQEVNWAFRPIPRNLMLLPSSSSSSPSSFMPSGSYLAQPFQVQPGELELPGPNLDFRIVDPPRRPHSGLWFMLQASQNQEKEPILPQIPKSYLRIKDGRMTVRLLMKYVVNKLRLDNESEIEITCRGEKLLPFLTLQHVRDNIWSPRNALTLQLPHFSTADHIMVLHYARTTP